MPTRSPSVAVHFPRHWLRALLLPMFAVLMLFTVTLAGGLAAPGAAHAADTPADTLRYSWPSNVGELNPHKYSPNQMFAQGMVYEPLVKYAKGGAIEPWLAESWTVSPDGKAYTFTLRKGVTFSDGTPFDARAVRMNFETVLANRARHDWLELVAQIDKVETPDARTVRLVLKNAYYPALQELALIRPVRFLSPSAFPASGNTNDGIKAPIGTGPWKLVETRKGEYDVLERNDAYWGKKPAIKRIVVRVIPDPNTRLVALQAGELDLVFGGGGHGGGQISLEAFDALKKGGTYAIYLSPPQASRVIALNSKSGPTADIAVRKAILHAIDKDAMVKGIFLNAEARADALFPPTSPYCDLKLPPYAHDTARAEALLDGAGWKRTNPQDPKGPRMKDGKPLSVDLCFVGNDVLQKAIAEFLQSELARVGVQANLIGEEEDAIGERQKSGAFGMVFGDTWGAPYDPHSFVSGMRVPTHADYQAQIGLPMKADIDARIGKVLLTTDETTRQNLYRDILTTLHDQAVYLPLTYQTSMVVHTARVDGVHFGAMDTEIPFEDMRLK
ncbi:nickel ABC transporter substrate-binding protein [Nitratidesulfovibrio termitidis]|uniref:nickel ABC transporter substrate-binding protein n=1 Tax=Nitratidesulfovibrio termitidis TaxID=42252 RepID=UPI0004167001|nr:nickel ABC transporter substrate-binding protein [Nitratidesulfovibrio termitidis]